MTTPPIRGIAIDFHQKYATIAHHKRMSDPLTFLLFASLIWAVIYRTRSDKHITLQPHKFWEVVRSQEHPVVLLTTRGLIIKRLCYVFPCQGILFCTDASRTQAPDGIRLIGTGDSFSLS